MKSNKKDQLIIYSLLTGIFVVLLIGIIFIPNSKASSNLENQLLDLSVVFYKEYYYKQLANAYDNEKLIAFLDHYSEMGIKVNLANLKEYAAFKDDYQKLVNDFDPNNNCNSKDTYVIFYPITPYGEDDYKTEVILDCKK